MQVLGEEIRQEIEELVIMGIMTTREFEGLLPGATSVWHEPQFQPPRSRPQVHHTRRLPRTMHLPRPLGDIHSLY